MPARLTPKMNQKSSLREAQPFVSQALTANTDVIRLRSSKLLVGLTAALARFRLGNRLAVSGFLCQA